MMEPSRRPYAHAFAECFKCAIMCDMGTLTAAQQDPHMQLDEQLVVLSGRFISVFLGSLIIVVVSVVVLGVLWPRRSVSAVGPTHATHYSTVRYCRRKDKYARHHWVAKVWKPDCAAP